MPNATFDWGASHGMAVGDLYRPRCLVASDDDGGTKTGELSESANVVARAGSGAASSATMYQRRPTRTREESREKRTKPGSSIDNGGQQHTHVLPAVARQASAVAIVQHVHVARSA